jgi:Middle or third domain of peptidase_M16
MQKLVPQNSRIIVVGQKDKEKCTTEELWYKTNFHYEKIEQAAIDVS